MILLHELRRITLIFSVDFPIHLNGYNNILSSLNKMSKIVLKEESFKIIGVCMEVHRGLGMGFKERVYKDALEVEFKEAQIPFMREKQFKIEYKGTILDCCYFADFIIYESVILEVKATGFITENFIAQTINYLKLSGIKHGIIGNFGMPSFEFKRIVF